MSYVVPVKSKVKVLQNFVAFSEYMNFTRRKLSLTWTLNGPFDNFLQRDGDLAGEKCLFFWQLADLFLSQNLYSRRQEFVLKLIYSEKVTKFCKISTVDLAYVVSVKSMVEISQI